jgi:hypothetical protein
MQKVLQWQIANTEIVKKENVGEIMITIKPLKSDGSIAPLISLKKIDFSIFLKRQGGSRDIKIFDGSLDEILEHIYAGTTMLEVVKTSLPTGYNLRLKFGHFPFILNGEDRLTIKLNAGLPSDCFTGGILTGSTIMLYTNPSPALNPYGLIPLYSNYSVGAGKINFEENIGNNVAKIVLSTDNIATFNDSTKSKVKTSRLLAGDGYKEDFTLDELIAKNQELLSVNPDSEIRNLVHFVSTSVLQNVDLEVDYLNQVDNDAKILVTRLEVS